MGRKTKQGKKRAKQKNKKTNLKNKKIELKSEFDKQWLGCFAGDYSGYFYTEDSYIFKSKILSVIHPGNLFLYYQYMLKNSIVTSSDLEEFMRDKTYIQQIRKFANMAPKYYIDTLKTSKITGMMTILTFRNSSIEMISIITLLLELGYLNYDDFNSGSFIAKGKFPVMVNEFMNKSSIDSVIVAQYNKNMFLMTSIFRNMKMNEFKCIVMTREGIIKRTIKI
uniref:Uncharacterized protein n=1 Tax=Pithovirus LCPAC403 TaxID=2506596 RepID=A0A481ZDK0_9VIRU|nr:MAG: uncharacterized protein LCPAC403_02530 [Pithovirus LCPAC403]